MTRKKNLLKVGLPASNDDNCNEIALVKLHEYFAIPLIMFEPLVLDIVSVFSPNVFTFLGRGAIYPI